MATSPEPSDFWTMLIAAVTTLAAVIAVLWRRLSSKEDSYTKLVEEARAAYLKQFAEITTTHAKQVSELVGQNRSDAKENRDALLEVLKNYHEGLTANTEVLTSMQRAYDRKNGQ